MVFHGFSDILTRRLHAPLRSTSPAIFFCFFHSDVAELPALLTPIPRCAPPDATSRVVNPEGGVDYLVDLVEGPEGERVAVVLLRDSAEAVQRPMLQRLDLSPTIMLPKEPENLENREKTLKPLEMLSNILKILRSRAPYREICQ